MKPRSSSAVISRWMPDFERRSSASFISSNEGGTPSRCHALLDEIEEFELLAGQHGALLPALCDTGLLFAYCSSRVSPVCVNIASRVTSADKSTISTAPPAARSRRRPDQQRVGLGEDRQELLSCRPKARSRPCRRPAKAARACSARAGRSASSSAAVRRACRTSGAPAARACTPKRAQEKIGRRRSPRPGCRAGRSSPLRRAGPAISGLPGRIATL